MWTNLKGNCDRCAVASALQGLQLCEKGANGTDDCTKDTIMTSNAGQWYHNIIIIIIIIISML